LRCRSGARRRTAVGIVVTTLKPCSRHGPNEVEDGDISCVSSACHQNATDTWDVVAGIEGAARRRQGCHQILRRWISAHGLRSISATVGTVFGDAKMTTALLDRPESWRFKSRAHDHASTRARPVSATPTSSDGANANRSKRKTRGPSWRRFSEHPGEVTRRAQVRPPTARRPP
jgi:hypothetical protein